MVLIPMKCTSILGSYFVNLNKNMYFAPDTGLYKNTHTDFVYKTIGF